MIRVRHNCGAVVNVRFYQCQRLCSFDFGERNVDIADAIENANIALHSSDGLHLEMLAILLVHDDKTVHRWIIHDFSLPTSYPWVSASSEGKASGKR